MPMDTSNEITAKNAKESQRGNKYNGCIYEKYS